MLIAIWPGLTVSAGLVSLAVSGDSRPSAIPVGGAVITILVPVLAATFEGAKSITNRALRPESVAVVMAAVFELLLLAAVIFRSSYQCWNPLCGA